MGNARRAAIVEMLRRAGLAVVMLLARNQKRSAPAAVCALTLLAVAAGHGQMAGATNDGTVGDAASSADHARLTSAARAYSPFDDVFRRYAGEEAGNDELIAIIAAATIPESGGNPLRVGDNGKSVGLFQIHEINGLSWNDRADPDRASAFMVPRFIAAYRQAKAEHPNLSGADLASLVAAMAERPEGWTDPTSIARMNYRESYLRLLETASRT